MEAIREFLGIASNGWTPNERFDSARSEAAGIKEQALASAEDETWLRRMSEQHWPYDDYEQNE